MGLNLFCPVYIRILLVLILEFINELDLNPYLWERSGSVVEYLTRDRGAAGSSLTGVTSLWSLSKTYLSKLSTGSTHEDPSLFN